MRKKFAINLHLGVGLLKRAYFCTMHKFLICGLIVLAFFMSQCDTKDEAIPAYLHLDSAVVLPKVGQGGAAHALAGVQIFANNRSMGVFPLPCNVPIIAEGNTAIVIQAMVYENGSNSVLKPFLSLATCDTLVNLKAGKTTAVAAVPFSFRGNCKIAWEENFEDNSSSLVPLTYNSSADTQYVASTAYDLNSKWAGTTRALHINVTAADTNKYFDLRSFSYLSNLPVDGRSIVLEFDIKNTLPLQLYVQRKNSSGEQIIPYYYIGTLNSNWTRYYINLAYEISGQESSATYKVFYSFFKKASASADQILIDNIRLTYLD